MARRDPGGPPAPFPGSRPRSGIDLQGKASCRDAIQLTKPDQGGHAHPAVTTTGHDAECLIEHLLRFRQPPRDAIDLAEMAERTDKGRFITVLAGVRNVGFGDRPGTAQQLAIGHDFPEPDVLCGIASRGCICWPDGSRRFSLALWALPCGGEW